MVGRAVRSAEGTASRHQIVIEVVDGKPRCTYLGVNLGQVDQLSVGEIEERIGGLRQLIVSQRLPQWIVQAISTEVGLLEAVAMQRLSHQMTIDQASTDRVLPPLDGIRLEGWEL